jgi:hypothetical protein
MLYTEIYQIIGYMPHRYTILYTKICPIMMFLHHRYIKCTTLYTEIYLIIVVYMQQAGLKVNRETLKLCVYPH